MNRTILALLTTLISSSQAATIQPQDNGAALVNPGMGWTMHFYSNFAAHFGSKLEPSDSLDDFPGESTVYLRVPWSYLEPKEDEYNWALFDTPAQRWIAAGKKVALRVSASDNWLPYSTPEWVHKAGAAGAWYDIGKGPHPDGQSWDPVFDDPTFLFHLKDFLKAMSERYDGNPDIAFIDVGTYGLWGEAHAHMSSMPTEEEHNRYVKLHIDLHKEYFPNTQLVISDDVVGSVLPGKKFPLSEYARERDVTIRDDSILVQPGDHAWRHDEMAQAFWPDLPVILEHGHYGERAKRGDWDPELLLKSVEDYHASYMSIHWWPHRFLRENRTIIDRINQRMGYRLQLKELNWPDTITRGKAFSIVSIWANAGVAPLYDDAFMTLTIKDAKGGLVAVLSDEHLNMRTLAVGPLDQAPTTKHRSNFSVGYIAPTTLAGDYDLYVSVGRRDGTPEIALPLDGDDGARRYKVGSITIQAEDFPGQYFPVEPIEAHHQVPHDRPEN
jgi:hypothetical protein